MTPVSYRLMMAFVWILIWAGSANAQSELNPAGEPRYGKHALEPGFAPAPFTHDALSGGDINVKSLRLGDNCLGYAARDPDFVIELTEEFRRITFLIASLEDTTLIINLPNGSWACNDDTNGLNPALVYFNAPPGDYRVWIGSYAAEAFDDSALYVSETGPESLPTTATGPDPSREPLYGETSLTRGFQPSPFSIQITGGGRNQAADYLNNARCRGYVSEAPDFSVYLDETFDEIWFSLYSPADLTLVVNAADGSWHCGDGSSGEDAAIAFRLAPAGLYDVWVGSADEGNYAAGILYLSEREQDESAAFTIDTRCEGLPGTALQVAMRAVATPAAGTGLNLYAAPETASTVVFRTQPGAALLLVGGPVCAEEHRWWRAELSDGSRAWIADGDASTRWLEPQN